jgi:hypothetical protein
MANNSLNNDSVPLVPDFGGTGVANVGTITVGGNTSFSGAFTFAGTLTGNTSVTFPTSGTLATTSGASGIVNSGTANQIAYYASTGTAVSGLAGAIGSVLVTGSAGVPTMLANPGASGRALVSTNVDTPAWTTCSYPNTVSQYSVLYANFTNAISSVVSTPRASFTTASTGEPTWVPLTNGQIVIGSTAGSPAAASLTAGTGISITPGSNSITIATTSSGEAAKFWIKANGTGTTILDSFNVTSITDTGSGLLTVTIGTDFSSANWCLNVSAQSSASSGYIPLGNTQAAGSILVAFINAASATVDPGAWYVSGFGNQ